MSKTTKRKHVTREVLDDYVLPEEHQQIVKVVAPRGNNLHEVKTSSGDKFLASMPNKFRKNVWIKRGDYVIVDPIEEGDKVKGEIIVILFPKQIKFIKKEGFWPAEFDDSKSTIQHQETVDSNIAEVTENLKKVSIQPNQDDYSDSDSDNDDDLFINTNRPPVTYYSSEESSSEEEEVEEDGDERPGESDEEESSVDH